MGKDYGRDEDCPRHCCGLKIAIKKNHWTWNSPSEKKPCTGKSKRYLKIKSLKSRATVTFEQLISSAAQIHLGIFPAKRWPCLKSVASLGGGKGSQRNGQLAAHQWPFRGRSLHSRCTRPTQSLPNYALRGTKCQAFTFPDSISEFPACAWYSACWQDKDGWPRDYLHSQLKTRHPSAKR